MDGRQDSIQLAAWLLLCIDMLYIFKETKTAHKKVDYLEYLGVDF